MSATDAVSPDALRAGFSNGLSSMYRREVPAYATLLGIVRGQPDVPDGPDVPADHGSDDRGRIGRERHGAIRLGLPDELGFVARLFALFGLHPVGHYDLAAAGVPVQSTAFRPVDPSGLQASPFRMFTSLLRLELIEDAAVRDEAAFVLARRDVAGDALRALVARAEAQGGVSPEDAPALLEAAVRLFAWHGEAAVDHATYLRLAGAHPVLADIAGFASWHLNHLTPSVVDIDAAHAAMAAHDLVPKPTIEGPPRRRVPILLRQTSFRARPERVAFGDAEWTHTARFGEIESRGAALTRAGRALYDVCLAAGDADAFDAIPDDLEALAGSGLAFVRQDGSGPRALTYEDFLPVSAAGIFRSNLGGSGRVGDAPSDRAAFEAALGRPCADEFALYEAQARV